MYEERNASEGIFWTAQIVFVVLKLVGVPYFAEASWWVIFLPALFAIVVSFITALMIKYMT